VLMHAAASLLLLPRLQPGRSCAARAYRCTVAMCDVAEPPGGAPGAPSRCPLHAEDEGVALLRQLTVLTRSCRGCRVRLA
jgi:hypothetical protein